jgi:hypothetical protein
VPFEGYGRFVSGELFENGRQKSSELAHFNLDPIRQSFAVTEI